MSPLITYELLENAMNYPTYVEMVRELCARRKTTGNPEFRGKFWVDLMIESLACIDNLLKSAQLDKNILKAIKKQEMPLTWLAVTEAWCIDSAHSLPIIYKMSETNPNINMKVILRDAPSKVIDNFLTRGGRSIPKVICLDAESLVVLGTWGPRPIELQAKMMLRVRAVNKLLAEDDDKAEDRTNEVVSIAKKWYKEDQTESIQIEVLESLLY